MSKDRKVEEPGGGGTGETGPPKRLRDFLRRDEIVLWLGAGASKQAEPPLPTLVELAAALRKEPGGDEIPGGEDPDLDPYRVFDLYLEEKVGTRGDLSTFLEAQFRPEGRDPQPGDLHRHLAAIARAGKLTAVIDPNYDLLLRREMGRQGVPHTPAVLDRNLDLPDRGLRYLSIHGSTDDWRNVVLTGKSYETFDERYHFLKSQLDVLLLRYPVLFVGSSLEDPRLLEWLDGLSAADRGSLKQWLAVVGPETEQRLAQREWKPGRSYLEALGDHLVLVELPDFAALPRWFEALAAEVSPGDAAAGPAGAAGAAEVIIHIDAGDEGWIVRGEGAEAPRAPLDLRDDLVRLRKATGAGLPVGADGRLSDDARQKWAALEALARGIGEKVTALLPEGVRSALLHTANRSALLGPAIVRLKVDGPAANDVLLLPWELLWVDGSFPVRDGKLHLVREVVRRGLEEGFPETPRPLSVVAHLAAPEGGEPKLPELRLEEAELRMARALDRIGARARFTEMGTLDDLVAAVSQARPTLLHFAGHGMPGKLVFENDLCEASPRSVGDLLHELAKTGPTLPLAVWLSCCYGAGTLGEVDAATREPAAATREWGVLEAEAPAVCADLHRRGIPQVLGYFGPVPDPLAVKVDRVLFDTLAETGDTLEAVRRARLGTLAPIDTRDGTVRYPLAWALLALYHRGPVRHLCAPEPEADRRAALPATVQEGLEPARLDLEGIEVMQHGFIGRRRLLAHLRRRRNRGDRCLGLYGLGGLGKTATMTRLASILTGGGKNWQQRVVAIPAGQYGEPGQRGEAGQAGESPPGASRRAAGIPRSDGAEKAAGSPFQWLQWKVADLGRKRVGEAEWDGKLKQVDEADDPPAALARLVLELAGEGGVVYVDNAETFQQVRDASRDRQGEQTGDAAPEAAPPVPWIDHQVARFMSILCGQVSGPTTVLVTTRHLPSDAPGHWREIPPCSTGELYRMTAWYPTLRRLPPDLRRYLAEERLAGHPRAVQWVEGLIRKAEATWRSRGGTEIDDASPEDVRRHVLDPALEGLPPVIEADLALTHLLARLDEPTRRHLADCTAIAQPVPWNVVDSLGDPQGHRTTPILRDLGLLTRYSVDEDAWAVHPFVRDHADGGPGSGPVLTPSPEAHLHLGEHWRQRGETTKSPTDLQESFDHFRAAEAWPEAGTVLRRLSLRLRHLGLWRARLALLESLSEVPWPEEQRATAWLYHLGDAKFFLGKYTEAEGHFREAIEVEESVYDTREHAEIAASLHGLANVLTDQGRYGEAEQAYRESIDIQKRAYGTREHASIAASLSGLANVLWHQGRHGEAEQAYRESIDIQKRAYGTREHAHIATSLHGLANVLVGQGKEAEAEEALREVLRIEERVFGRSRPLASVLTMVDLAKLLLSRDGESTEALELLRGAWATSLEHGAVVEMGKAGPALADLLIDREMHEERARLAGEVAEGLAAVAEDHPARPKLVALRDRLAGEGEDS